MSNWHVKLFTIRVTCTMWNVVRQNVLTTTIGQQETLKKLLTFNYRFVIVIPCNDEQNFLAFNIINVGSNTKCWITRANPNKYSQGQPYWCHFLFIFTVSYKSVGGICLNRQLWLCDFNLSKISSIWSRVSWWQSEYYDLCINDIELELHSWNGIGFAIGEETMSRVS